MSPWGKEQKWDLLSVIFKGGDDCRQEVLAMQLIVMFDRIWKAAGLPLRLRPYTVLITSATSGLIETISDSTSVDSLKKTSGFTTLAKFFEDYFGGKGNTRYAKAQKNFVEKYGSILCCLLFFTN